MKVQALETFDKEKCFREHLVSRCKCRATWVVVTCNINLRVTGHKTLCLLLCTASDNSEKYVFVRLHNKSFRKLQKRSINFWLKLKTAKSVCIFSAFSLSCLERLLSFHMTAALLFIFAFPFQDVQLPHNSANVFSSSRMKNFKRFSPEKKLHAIHFSNHFRIPLSQRTWRRRKVLFIHPVCPLVADYWTVASHAFHPFVCVRWSSNTERDTNTTWQRVGFFGGLRQCLLTNTLWNKEKHLLREKEKYFFEPPQTLRLFPLRLSILRFYAIFSLFAAPRSSRVGKTLNVLVFNALAHFQWRLRECSCCFVVYCFSRYFCCENF